MGMGPLQKLLAKEMPMPSPSQSPSPPPTTSNAKKQRKKSTKHQTTTMQWHDNISSYKCFETIATPSPIPNGKSKQNQTLHRSTSLDSLASSEPNHTDNSSQGSWCVEGDEDDNDNNNTDQQSDTLSQCDSISDSKEREVDSDSNEQDCIYEPFFNDSPQINREKPFVTELVRKKTSEILCENRHCAYRQFQQYHSVNDCAPNTENFEYNVASTSSTIGEESKHKENTSNAPFILNKTRRTSVASSGSVSRMETIVEEPIEPKISVKEILARFETLTSIEVRIQIFFFF